MQRCSTRPKTSINNCFDAALTEIHGVVFGTKSENDVRIFRVMIYMKVYSMQSFREFALLALLRP